MAVTPRFKVYTSDGEYVASCKYLEDAARLIRNNGDTIREGHSKIIWIEGKESLPAHESFDGAASIMTQRVKYFR